MVNHATFPCALLECWQHQSNCRIIEITWHTRGSTGRRIYGYTQWIFHAFSEDEISEAISYATAKLGYKELRPKQDLAVKHFLRGHNVFVSLPTGSGKSLCYCLLLKAFDFLRRNIGGSCIIVVISPLIALIHDQVRAMRERGVSAVYAGMADEELEAEVCTGEYQLVFLSPESLLTDDHWRDMLQSPVYHERLVGFVVYEAHCVKKW